MLIAALAAILLACSQTAPPTHTPESTATFGAPIPTPIPPTPRPATVPTNPQCPTVPKDDDSDEIKPEEWLVRAIKIAIKEELDKPETLEWIYPKELYLYSGRTGDGGWFKYQRTPSHGRGTAKLLNMYPVQIYDMRGDSFVHLVSPIRSDSVTLATKREDGSSFYRHIMVNFWTPYDSRWVFIAEHEALISLFENTESRESLPPSWFELPSTKEALEIGTQECLVGEVLILPAWHTYHD